MPNGHGQREYGRHKYADYDGTSDCEYGCGCWMGSARSGGPVGLDPGGTCPNNPIDGEPLGGKEDYEYVVKDRIQKLGQRLHEAEERLRRVSPSKLKLSEELKAVKEELFKKEQRLAEVRRIVEVAG